MRAMQLHLSPLTVLELRFLRLPPYGFPLNCPNVCYTVVQWLQYFVRKAAGTKRRQSCIVCSVV